MNPRHLTEGVIRVAALAWIAAAAPTQASPTPVAPTQDATTEAGSYNPVSIDDLMQLLGKRTRGEVNFSETQYFALLDRPLRSSGTLLYVAPAHLEKRTLLPKRASLIIDGHTLTMQSGKRSRVLDVREYPQLAPFVESIRATLAGDRAALEAHFQVQLAGTLAEWEMTLDPGDEALKKFVQHIRITGRRDQLVGITTMQASGDRSVMTIEPAAEP